MQGFTVRIFRILAKSLLLLVVAVLLVGVLFFRQEVYRVYKAVTFFSPDNIAWNFKHATSIYPYTTVQKAPSPTTFADAATPIKLPSSFVAEGVSVDTQAHLAATSTDAFLVLHDGKLVYENYTNQFTEQDHHLSWSMCKSVISTLVGIAVDEGKIKSIEQPVTEYVPELLGTGYDHVRIKDVLQMSSGVAFNENYADFNSDINVFGRYFALGTPLVDFVKRLKRERTPGTFNHYVSMDTQVLGMLLTKSTGQTITQYMHDKLWSKIGSESDAYWLLDSSDMEFAFGGLNATARDYAKLGQLYLQKGNWQGQQIVSKAWIKASLTPDAPHLMPGKRDSALLKDGYGYQWWIPFGTTGDFVARGIYGQYIFVDPNHNTVIVKLSSDAGWKDRQGQTKETDMALFRAIAQQFARN